MCADTILHFEPVSGIAGDMSVAVLCGLGLDIKEMAEAVSAMVQKDITARTDDVSVSGIMCKRLRLDLPHEHVHRTMKDIRALFHGSSLDDKVVNDALGIFGIIAAAEGRAHGKEPDEVHFHEVGAMDSIFDIAAFAYGLHRLGISAVTSSAPALGGGFVKCAHGLMPVPAPAVLNILEGMAVRPSDEQKEMTTPTGAAILKYYVKEFSPLQGRIIRSASSTGNLEFVTVPNILRGILTEQAAQSGLVMMETNIDDCTGEVIGQLFEDMKDFCTDMTVTQGTGKKNRPVFVINVLCEAAKREKCAEILFSHTSTAGVRFSPVDRIVMDRKMTEVSVDGVRIGVKVLSYGKTVKAAPEWDDCVKAAEKLKTSPMAVYDRAKAEWLKSFSA